MLGTIAPTDYGWYELLRDRNVAEVNFWRPSADRRFNAPAPSPFLFKLKAPHNAICGIGIFSTYSALPYWLAWDAFGIGNGCQTQREMWARIATIRERMNYRGKSPRDFIGCILIVEPIFFDKRDWVPQPSDWPARNLTPMRYDLSSGEGLRVWQACLERTQAHGNLSVLGDHQAVEVQRRFGTAYFLAPRLGQGTFRIAVTDAYARACVVTGEHSLPALEAAHIKPFAEGGPHATSNGLLLRADFHRLFDQGYLTVTQDLTLEVSRCLKEDYENGKSYYPFHGKKIPAPPQPQHAPSREFLIRHNSECYRG